LVLGMKWYTASMSAFTPAEPCATGICGDTLNREPG
jgi:hypothetical protein